MKFIMEFQLFLPPMEVPVVQVCGRSGCGFEFELVEGCFGIWERKGSKQQVAVAIAAGSLRLVQHVEKIQRDVFLRAKAESCPEGYELNHHSAFNGIAVISYLDDIFDSLLTALSDSSDEVVLLVLEVLASIAQDASHFHQLAAVLVRTFQSDHLLLEKCGALIVRRLCPLHIRATPFNQIPYWLADWIPETGGYLIGNLQPAHMDFRFFSLGNIWAVISSLTTPRQAEGILNLIEEKWDDLVGDMPLKICYPALEYEEWRIITGSDPKNTPWSYHNAGSWPTLLWQFTLACIKMGRPELAHRAISVAEKKLAKDKWPEYYDTQAGRFIGKQSRLYQTWTIAGYLTAKMLLENPELASILTCDEDLELLEGCACNLSKSPRTKCSRSGAKSYTQN